MNKIICVLFLSIFIFSGCEDWFEPAPENIIPKEFMYEDGTFATSLLLSAYARIPSNGWINSDLATDNAVSNDPANAFRGVASGRWSSDFNPLNQWDNSYSAIMYLNLIINGAERIHWVDDPDARFAYARRYKGEAHGLRALFMLYLMQAHAGIATNGQLLGVPIITEFLEADANFNIPRATFQETMEFIYSDLDSAMAMLPLDYGIAPLSDPHFLNKFAPLGISADAYGRAFSSIGRGRMSGRIAEAIRSRATLFAASPAYSMGSETTWHDAAVAAATVLERVGIARAGHTPAFHQWFSHAGTIDGLADGANPPEIIWRTAFANDVAPEQMNFPPTLAGQGQINPTRNFVDAFGDINGFPINHPSSNFNPQNPYANRDPRLELYVIRNNSVAGVANTRIFTGLDAATNDGRDRVSTSTRTGYYLRKLVRMYVNLNPVTARNRILPHIRYTEIFLNYAEAANEYGGPLWVAPGASFSALDVVRAIRRRAGISAADPYLASITSRDDMRTLIHNERRLELSFEGFRFWDLRRWEAPLNVPATGSAIRGVAPNFTFAVDTVEQRVFMPHMIYGPIPKSEVLKFDALLQNQGW